MRNKRPEAFEIPDSEDEEKKFKRSQWSNRDANQEDSRLIRLKGLGKASLGGVALGGMAGLCFATGGMAFLPLVLVATFAVPEIFNKPSKLFYEGLKETLSGKKADQSLSKNPTLLLGSGKIALGISSVAAVAILTIGTGGWLALPIIVAGIINPSLLKKPFKLIYDGAKDIISSKKNNAHSSEINDDHSVAQTNHKKHKKNLKQFSNLDVEKGIEAHEIENPNKHLPARKSDNTRKR